MGTATVQEARQADTKLKNQVADVARMNIRDEYARRPSSGFSIALTILQTSCHGAIRAMDWGKCQSLPADQKDFHNNYAEELKEKTSAHLVIKSDQAANVA